MEEAKVRGVVHLVEEPKTYGARGFRKRTVVLEQPDGRFTNYIPVEFVQSDCELADGVEVGQEVEVTYRLKGRRWQRDENSEVKFFLNAEAFEIEVLEGGGAAASPPPDDEPPPIDDDEIPF